MITEIKEHFKKYAGDSENKNWPEYYPKELNVKNDYNALQLMSFKNIDNAEILEYQRNTREYKKTQSEYDYKKPKVARFKLYFRCPFYKHTFYSYDNYRSKGGNIIINEYKALIQLTKLAVELNFKFGKDAECLFFMCLNHDKVTFDFSNHNELCQIITKENKLIRNSSLEFKTLNNNELHQFVNVKNYKREFLK